MATPVDTLLVRIEADMAGLRRDLNKVQKQTGKVGSAFKGLGKIIAGVLTAAAGVKIVNTIRQFEDLQATLVSVTGSAELAATSFELIRKFTATTTFQLEQTTGAFITLANAGIAPTSGVLTDVGNLAAAMGKDIRTVAQAIFNATTGEMEMLKQFGIVAKVEGENLAVTYKGVTETIDRSSDSIVEYIRTLSQQNFPDAIEARANTLSGAISNLGDQISEFFMAIGEGGFKDALTDLVRDFSSILEAARPLARLIGQVLGAAFVTFNVIIVGVAENARALTAALVALFATIAISKISAAGGAMVVFGKATKAAAASVAILNANLKRNLLGALAAVAAFATVKLLDFLDSLGDSGDAADEAADAYAELDEAMAAMETEAAKSGIEKLNSQVTELASEVTAARLEVDGLNSQFASTVAEAFPGMDNLAMIRQLGPDVSEALGLLIRRHQQLSAEQERLQQIDAGVSFVEQKTEAEELQGTLRDLAVAYDNGAISQNEYQQATKDLGFQLKMTQPIFETVFDALQQAGRRVADSIAESLMKMEFSLSSFTDIAKMLVQQIISKFIQLAIVNQVLNALFPGANLATISLGGRATGGNVNPRQPYIVGERGPEVFIPSSAGSIQNSNQTRSMTGGGGGGITINQTLQVETGVSQTVRAEMINLLPVIKNDTINAVADARRRGGRFSSAFGA